MKRRIDLSKKEEGQNRKITHSTLKSKYAGCMPQWDTNQKLYPTTIQHVMSPVISSKDIFFFFSLTRYYERITKFK